MNKKRIIIIVIIGLVLLSAGVFLYRVQNTQKINVVEKSIEYDSVVKNKIASFLKSPGSAKFIDFVIKNAADKENQYIAFGDIDSQNSFGALIRSHCFAELTYLGGDISDSDNWRIDLLDFDDINYITNGKTWDEPLPLDQDMITIMQNIENSYRNSKTK